MMHDPLPPVPAAPTALAPTPVVETSGFCTICAAPLPLTAASSVCADCAAMLVAAKTEPTHLRAAATYLEQRKGK